MDPTNNKVQIKVFNRSVKLSTLNMKTSYAFNDPSSNNRLDSLFNCYTNLKLYTIKRINKMYTININYKNKVKLIYRSYKIYAKLI